MLKKVQNWLLSLLSKTHAGLQWGIKITNDIKAVADDKTLADAVKFTPTPTDDTILAAAKVAIALLLAGLGCADKLLSELTIVEKTVVLNSIAAVATTVKNPAMSLPQALAAIPGSYDASIFKS